MKTDRFTRGMVATFAINIVCVLIVIFGGKSDMCNPGPGFVFGAFIFAPLTVIGFIGGGALWIVDKSEVARGVTIAEAITIGFTLALLFI